MKMKQTLQAMLVTLMLGFGGNGALAIDGFRLPENPETLARYQVLAEEFRCLVCQNQNLADSNAELAKDLKQELVKLLESGKSDDEIREFLVARYGDFVLYRPPLNNSTVILWMAPLIGVFCIGFVILLLWRRGRQQAPAGASNDQLDAALAQLRNRTNNNSTTNPPE